MDPLDLLFDLGRVFDLAREQALELERLKLNYEQLQADYNALVGTSMKQAHASERNTLLMGLAMSGDEGRKMAVQMIENEPKG